MGITLEQARAAYAAQAPLRSPHTLQAYLRAVDLLLICLADRQFAPRLPLHQYLNSTADELDLDKLCAEDNALLRHFAQWMQNTPPPYALSTIELRLAGVQHWLEFLRQKQWLPPEFSLEEAIEQTKTYLQTLSTPEAPAQSTIFEHDLSDFLVYYRHQQPSRALQSKPLQLARWELTRLRNHALIQVLAETGGQVSAILSLNMADVMSDQIPLQIDLAGKNEHTYPIILETAVPALREYLAKRELEEASPLFISHDAHYEGQRMSRVIAWRIIQRAAKAVHLPELSPHDLRHWRAKQLIEAGLSAEELQMRLGHRTLSTIYAYYGEWLGRV